MGNSLLQKIENNEANAGSFSKGNGNLAKSITDELLQTSIAQNSLPKLVCPKCKSQQLIIRDKIVKMLRWSLRLDTVSQCAKCKSVFPILKTLWIKGNQSYQREWKYKAGKKFDAYIVLDADCKPPLSLKIKAKKIMTDITISQKEIASIHTIRDKSKVILDADLAMLYQVETKALKQGCKEKPKPLSWNFCFQLLSEQEVKSLKYQFGTSNVGKWRRTLPFCILWAREWQWCPHCCEVI